MAPESAENSEARFLTHSVHHTPALALTAGVFRLDLRMFRALLIVLLAVFSTTGCRSAPARPAPASSIPTAPARSGSSGEREAFLEQYARGYFPGRSGQIFLVPAEGHFIVDRELPLYQFMHGSPWEYDTHVPLLFYGPPFVRQMTSSERTSQQDVAPTLAALLRTSPPRTASGHPLRQAIVQGTALPRAIAIMVLDGARADYFTKYAALMPTLSRLRAEGAWFDNAHVSSAPTVTAVGHANIGTGTQPATHGLAVNHAFNRVTGSAQEAYAGLDPGELMALTLADVWNLETDGKAVIVGQGGAMRATAGLIGHGACLVNGRPVIAASYATEGGWETNDKCYVMSAALASLSAKKYWTTERTSWMGHDIADGNAFKATALFQRFEGDALAAVLEREPIGADEITDLVFVNLKGPDYTGHAYGPDSTEIRETLKELDTQVARALAILERKAGKGRFVVAITADHGMPGGNGRHFAQDLIAAIDGKFGKGTVQMLRDGANSQVHLDTARVTAAGHTLQEVASFLVNDTTAVGYIKYAFTEAEVRAAQGRLPH
jgi:hypothetical protein